MDHCCTTIFLALFLWKLCIFLSSQVDIYLLYVDNTEWFCHRSAVGDIRAGHGPHRLLPLRQQPADGEGPEGAAAAVPQLQPGLGLLPARGHRLGDQHLPADPGGLGHPVPAGEPRLRLGTLHPGHCCEGILVHNDPDWRQQNM